MQNREPTLRSRELGDALRAAMERVGYDGARIANELGWSRSRVSRLLSGTRGGTDLDVASFLALCRVTGTQREHLIELARDVDLAGWLQRHGTRLPTQLRTLVKHEDKASHVADFQSTLIPGMLQTGDYARALIQDAGTVPEDEIDERVEARLARQSLFNRPRPATFAFYVHESVLRLPVRSAPIMSEQLHHLLRMSVRPSIRIRVVPYAAGAHAAVNGSFKLMDFADFHPIVYIESETSTLFLEEPLEIAAYRRIVNLLAGSALDEGQSRGLIATLATELYWDGDHDDGTAFPPEVA